MFAIDKIRHLLALLLGPILFFVVSFLFDFSFISQQANVVIAVAVWMIVWWVTEAIPIPVTALLPIVLFPLLGVFDFKTACVSYANPIIFLFMGGFLIALGIEKSNLHQRIALRLIKMTGTTPNRVILGFMLATALLSMWISNTATTVMMLPIAVSVINQLATASGVEEKGSKHFGFSLMLSIAYAANIGGTATVIGTPPNAVLLGLMKDLYGIDISFTQWMMVGFPFAAIMLWLSYIVLIKVIIKSKNIQIEVSKDFLKEKLKGLGALSKREKMVIMIFALTTFCWIFKSWINTFFINDVLSDTTIALIGGILMFVLPVDLKNKARIIAWQDTKELPWGILILFGGGLTLAKALQKVAIIDFVGNSVAGYSDVHWLMIGFALVLIMLFATELMSNVALTTIFVPVVAGISMGMFDDPLLFAIPVTLASSCAFMLPIATPPNAIVFSAGYIRMKQMIRVGFILNIIASLLIGIGVLCLLRLFWS